MVSCFCSDEEVPTSSPEVVEIPPSSPEVVKVSPPPPRRGPKQKKANQHPTREQVHMCYEGKSSFVIGNVQKKIFKLYIVSPFLVPLRRNGSRENLE